MLVSRMTLESRNGVEGSYKSIRAPEVCLERVAIPRLIHSFTGWWQNGVGALNLGSRAA